MLDFFFFTSRINLSSFTRLDLVMVFNLKPRALGQVVAVA